jgi:hypothetical protein
MAKTLKPMPMAIANALGQMPTIIPLWIMGYTLRLVPL